MKNIYKRALGLLLLSSLIFSVNIVFADTQEEQRITLLQEKIVELQKILSMLLEQKRALDLERISTASSSPYADFSYVFKIGVKDSETNGEVSSLQEKLINDGFLADVADGKFGPKTAAAVEKMKNFLNIFDQKTGEFNPLSLYHLENNQKTYSPKKITEFLGSDQLEFYSLPFPFDKQYIKNVSCNNMDVNYVFKDNAIIFPVSFPYDADIKKISCNLS